MSCESIQVEICSGEHLSSEAKQHLQACPYCKGLAEFESSLTSRLSELYEVAPPEYLNGRIASGLRQRSRPRFWSGAWFATAGAFATAVLVFLLLGSGGQAEAAYLRMLTRARLVRTAHVTVTALGRGKVYELWWQPGAWREKSPSDLGGDRLKLQQAEGLMFYRYEPTTGKLLIAHEIGDQLKSFELKDVAAAYMGTPATFQETNRAGREVIEANDAFAHSRLEFTVDPSTGLPTEADKQHREGGAWATSYHLSFEFNKPLPAGIFLVSDLPPKP